MNAILNLDKGLIMKIAVALFISMAIFLPFSSKAQNTTTSTSENEITKTLCNAVNLLTGTVGRSIAILIVISLAISLFLGKVSWGVAIAVGVGMGILFGARDVVDLLSGGTTCKS